MSDRSKQGASAADQLAIDQARQLGRLGAAGVPKLIEALETRSWVVRRRVVEELSELGVLAVDALCAVLRERRQDESRLAAVVDALAGARGDIDAKLIELLGEADVAVVCDGLQVLGRRGARFAAARVVALTAHTDDNVAVAAVEALGQIGGPEALACLVHVLHSASFFRSFPAIDVLGRLGDTGAVEPLLGLLGDALRGPEAARALGRLGDETAIPALLSALTVGQVAGIRVAAVALADIHARLLERYGSDVALERGLAGHVEDSSLQSRLNRALTGSDAAEKRALGLLLGFFSGVETVELLLPLLAEQGQVAETAALSLGRLARSNEARVIEQLGALSSQQRLLVLPQLAGLRAAVPLLVDSLTDPEPQVRILACDALARTGDPSAAPALLELLDDPDLSVSQAATAALQSLGTQQTQELVVAAAAAGTAPQRRRAALRILAYFGAPSALPALLSAASDADERSREIALSGLASFTDARALQLLLEASVHESARTRAAALRALGNAAPSPALLARLREATSDPDAWVRYYACQALGNVGDTEATALLYSSTQDPAGQVRVAAVDAIARLPGPPALEILARAAEHPDLEVRRAALTGIGVTRHETLLPLLLEASRAPEAATRLVAVSSLAKYAAPAALSRVCELAAVDADATVRSAALELLSEDARAQASDTLLELVTASEPWGARARSALCRRAAERAPHLVSSLVDAPAAVAEVVIAALTRLPTSLSQPLLLEAMKLPNENARRAAVRALRIAFDSPQVSAELAHAAAHDQDPEVRRVAVARLS